MISGEQDVTVQQTLSPLTPVHQSALRRSEELQIGRKPINDNPSSSWSVHMQQPVSLRIWEQTKGKTVTLPVVVLEHGGICHFQECGEIFIHNPQNPKIKIWVFDPLAICGSKIMTAM